MFEYNVKCYSLLENNTYNENPNQYNIKYEDHDLFIENIESFLWNTLRYYEDLNKIYKITIVVKEITDAELCEYYHDLEYMVYLESNKCTIIEDIAEYRDIKIGDIVRHFKYKYLNLENQRKNRYTYKVLGFATHSESKEKMVVYQGLYTPFEVYVRPFDMFMSEIDHEKYMNDDQVFRFYKANM